MERSGGVFETPIKGPAMGELKTPLLDGVHTPADLRRMKPGELRQFADELRCETIDAV